MVRCIAPAGLVTLTIFLFIQLSAVAAWGGRASPACLYSMVDAPGRVLCIHAGSLNRDICSAMETFATRSQLPPDFFARLIWRESRFRAEAISPKGAQGIAQFMPATAALRGLKDSFDVLEALRASSQYLMKLRTRFGNLGLAAAAYNAGEQRVSTFLLVGGLPLESRNYVFGITGHTADEWRRSPSDLILPPLDEHRAFMDACVALAATRRLVEPADQSEGVWTPWGGQLAAAANSVTARALFTRISARLPAPLNTEAPLILRKKDRDFGYKPRYSARIGRTQRRDAEDACKIVERAGFPCLVFKNF